MIHQEEWRPFLGGNYSISSVGRIRRDAGGAGARVGRELRTRMHNGYLRISLRVNGDAKDLSVHRIVAEAFLGPCPRDCEVNHRNGIKIDNRVENLEYVSHRENTKHAFRMGLVRSARGEAHHCAKLTTEEVLALRKQRMEMRTSWRALGRQYGVSNTTARLICLGRKWRHLA